MLIQTCSISDTGFSECIWMQVAKPNQNLKSGAKRGLWNPDLKRHGEEYVPLQDIKELR